MMLISGLVVGSVCQHDLIKVAISPPIFLPSILGLIYFSTTFSITTFKGTNSKDISCYKISQIIMPNE